MGQVAQAMLGASELADRSSGKVISALDTLAASRLKQGEMGENRRRSIIQEGQTDTQLGQMERRITQEDEQLQESRRRNLADEELRQKELEESARTRESRETLGIMQLQAQMFEARLNVLDKFEKVQIANENKNREDVTKNMQNFFEEQYIIHGGISFTEEERAEGKVSPYITPDNFGTMLKKYSDIYKGSAEDFAKEADLFAKVATEWSIRRANNFFVEKTKAPMRETDVIDTLEDDKSKFPTDSPYRLALDTIGVQMKKAASEARRERWFGQRWQDSRNNKKVYGKDKGPQTSELLRTTPARAREIIQQASGN